MLVEAHGTRLWFDIEGPVLVPDGVGMRQRPTLLLLHGGPGTYDHSYFKPWFARAADVAQVVYLDLRDHGRSARHDPAAWSFEVCADDVRAFCDALGIERPVVLGHSMGGFVALLYAARHPDHPGGLVLQSTMARFDLDRLTEGFRRVGGERVAGSHHGDAGSADEEPRPLAGGHGPDAQPRPPRRARRSPLPRPGLRRRPRPGDTSRSSPRSADSDEAFPRERDFR